MQKESARRSPVVQGQGSGKGSLNAKKESYLFVISFCKNKKCFYLIAKKNLQYHNNELLGYNSIKIYIGSIFWNLYATDKRNKRRPN